MRGRSRCNYVPRGRTYEEAPARLARDVSGNVLFRLVVQFVVAEGQYGLLVLAKRYSWIEFLGACFV